MDISQHCWNPLSNRGDSPALATVLPIGFVSVKPRVEARSMSTELRAFQSKMCGFIHYEGISAQFYRQDSGDETVGGTGIQLL